MNKLAKIALTATIALAITLTLTACEEKKKQDGTTTTATEPAAEAATQEAVAEKPAEEVEAKTVCGKGGGGVKLPECIIDADGKLVQKFEYDEQNRITKVYKYNYYGGDGNELKDTDTLTITYDSSGSVTVKEHNNGYSKDAKYIKNGNTVTVEDKSFTINKEGYIVVGRSGCLDTYEYKDGNLISKKTECENENYELLTYEYDDKKSPFSNSNTPKWLIQCLNLGGIYESKNNVVDYEFETSSQGGSRDYKYEYDSEGFPTKCIETYHLDGEEGSGTEFYIYRSGN